MIGEQEDRRTTAGRRTGGLEKRRIGEQEERKTGESQYIYK